MCTNYSEAVSADDSESSVDMHMFNRLIFLKRNWQEDDDFGERPSHEFDELVSTWNKPMHTGGHYI